MTFAARIDYASLMEPVATRLLGEPNQNLSKPPRGVRFGNHGSTTVDMKMADGSTTRTRSAAAYWT